MPPPESLPPPAYYTEPGSRPVAPPRHPPQLIWEPPPPPQPRHVAPRTALWAGVRAGWFFPFGNIRAQGIPAGPFLARQGVPWSDFSASGPMVELDVGLRLARSYALFALWERAELGSGSSTALGQPDGGSTDFWGIGLRASSDPNGIGFLTEIALGYRRARADFRDGSALELTDGIFEARLGVGADIRINPHLSLSPMATLGVGSFGEVEYVSPSGVGTNLIGPLDDQDAHGWFTIGVGGHLDLLGQR
ncbi:MAG TPA: hypothetical protein VKY73_05205 [Polyangiaceae bacterium]|nr:hypothetical protein [Polyangiaceae bacterium]